MHNHIVRTLEEGATLRHTMVKKTVDDIVDVTQKVIETFRQHNKVLVCGNGGSAADAQHFAAEMINRLRYDRAPLPMLALTTDTSVLTSIGNDAGYDEIFAKQVAAFGQPGDVLIVITTSDIEKTKHGHSTDIARALEVARSLNVATIGLVSQKSQRILPFLDYKIAVPHNDSQRIQEAHITLIHIISELVERALFPM